MTHQAWEQGHQVFWPGQARSTVALPALSGSWSWTVEPRRCPAARPWPAVWFEGGRRFFSSIYCHIGVETAQILAATALRARASTNHAPSSASAERSVPGDHRVLHSAAGGSRMPDFAAQICCQRALAYAHYIADAHPGHYS